MYLIFLGPPGAGKGTHAQRVCDVLGIPRLSTGDMLRQQIQAGTELGKAAQSFIDAGHLVPDDVVVGMLKERLNQPDCAQGAVFDGFPRTVRQAQVLDTLVPIHRVVNLVLSDEAIIRRMTGRRVCPQCGKSFHTDWLQGETCTACGTGLIIRKDDLPETVVARLKVYHEQTQPLIEYYTARGILRDASTDGSIEEVAKRIQGALE